MKKKDVIELLEYRKKLIDSMYASPNRDNRYFEILDVNLPQIDGLRDEISVLNGELERIKDKKRKAIEYVEEKKALISSIRCEHPFAFSYRNTFGSSCYCALCDCEKELKTLKGRVVLEKDSYDEDGNFYRRYNFEEIYEILMNELKNYSEEVDIIKVFKRLFDNGIIGDMIINGKSYVKNYNILIVGGTNKIDIENGVFLSGPLLKSVVEIVNYFQYTHRCKVRVAVSKNMEFKKYYGVSEYETVEELNSYMESIKNQNIDLIIDMSYLFNYEIKDDKINIKKININFNEKFPNAIVIKIDKDIDLKEFNSILDFKLEDSTLDKKKVLLKR